ncbi:MAG TPA: hypothetical protein VG104_04420 [Candidatus Dormibacteraeota bacterium]|jgi:hypothetical protein|nr:hypothetical protein [Candidatus Dormibacteraeota bacterium]
MTLQRDILQKRSRRWSTTRIGVVLLAACWLLLASSLPASLHGTGIVIVLALLALDLALGVTTDWLAFLPTSRLDERQAALRDRAYRVAFRLVAVGVLLMVVFTIVGAIAAGDNLQNVNAVPDAISPRHLMAFLELLLVAPTAVIAWLQDGEPGSELGRPQAWWPLLLVPLLAGTWFAAVQVLPAQVVTTRGMNGTFEASGASCDHFAAEKSVAGGLGGTARLKVEVCWDGQHAWAFGDPSLHTPMDIVPSPVPASELVSPLSMPSLRDLTSCAPRDPDGDFVGVSESCTQQIGPDGTMRLIVHGSITPLPSGVGRRDVQIQLVVDANGRVLAEG